MTRNNLAASLILAGILALTASSGATARGAGHNTGPQRTNGSGCANNGGQAGTAAAKSVNLGGLARFVLSNALKAGKLDGSLKSVGGAMAGPGKCPGGVCGPQL